MKSFSFSLQFALNSNQMGWIGITTAENVHAMLALTATTIEMGRLVFQNTTPQDEGASLEFLVVTWLRNLNCDHVRKGYCLVFDVELGHRNSNLA